MTFGKTPQRENGKMKRMALSGLAALLVATVPAHAVDDTTWGRIKAGFGREGLLISRTCPFGR